jgi:hypothetical protein
MRILVLLAILFVGYWFILRPVFRRHAQLAGFYSAADAYEAGLLTKLSVMFKGFKTIVWARFLMVAGTAVPLLDAVGMFDLSSLLPPIDLGALTLQPYQYSIFLVTAIGWVTERLRHATTTPVGELEMVIVAAPEIPLPPVVPAGR